MNKKLFILLFITFIVLIAAVYSLKINQKDSHGCFVNKGYSWCGFEQKCIKEGEEDCNLTQDWILDEAKKIMGLDINIMPSEVVKWNTKDGETAFSAKGFVYTDILGAEKIVKSYNGINNFLKQIGFEGDSYNLAVNSEKEKSVKYKNEKLICALSQINNPNNTSSLFLLCGDVDGMLCNFNSDCGKECQNDSDCGLAVDGCAKKVVCRNKNYKFYQDCLNPTAAVSEINTTIGSCLCLENQCVPEKQELHENN